MSARTPTAEQQAILEAAACGERVAISAGAGSGKTSTLQMIASARPKTSMLYLAYNKAIQLDAQKRFPANVTAKTAHGLAYPEFGAPMRSRLNGPRMRGTDTARVLGIRGDFGLDDERLFGPGTQASMAMAMVARFCRSADEEITTGHFVAPEGLSAEEARALAHHLLPVARRAWEDLSAGPKGRLHLTHDVYLKQWQLSHPKLTGWDVILYDEAQDADPAIADVVEHQLHAQLIAVGDSAQAIYAWRGAGDFLARMDGAHRLCLTQSWRFGQGVADEANVWLEVLGTDMRIVGNPARTSTVAPLAHPDTILCRTNAGTIDAVLDAHERAVPVHLVGGGKQMLGLAQAAQRLQDGKPAGHAELAAFSTWDQVVEYARDDPAGSDLAVAVRMIERYGAEGVMSAIDSTVSERAAQLVVSTAHKAKGLEWAAVRIADDFTEPRDKKTGALLPVPRADAMLGYVAITRAMDTLDSGGLSWVHEHLAALAHCHGDTMKPDITSTALALPPEAVRPTPVLDEQSPSIMVGSRVLVADERGVYIVASENTDGSLTCYPVGEHGGGARSFRPEWCVPTEYPAKGGNMVQVRAVPATVRRARALWREQHGFASFDHACTTSPGVAL